MSSKPERKLGAMNAWIGNDNSIWLGSLLTLTRNVQRFNFPGKLSSDKRKQIISLLSKDLLGSSHLVKPSLIKAEEIQAIEKEYLMEHFMIPQSLTQAQSGEGFIIDETGKFLATLNIRDHLVLCEVDVSEKLEESWQRLINLESEHTKNVSFAFSNRFGYLTSDPMQCGTAFVVYVYLHLPALIYTGQLEETIRKYKEDGIEHAGLQGSPGEIIGDIVVFHNGYTLGVTEENIISSLRTLVTKLVIAEKSARAKLKKEENALIKDKISRAYAILLHSYQIGAVEALSAVSLIKLGLDLGWVSNATQSDVNNLLFSTRRSHLLCHFGGEIAPEELLHKRAEYIHSILKGITLQI